ncbi:MAG TPA: hypothetical protein PK268_03090 [Enterococcus sp.]|nr:hypothetical protein [Enterococcus sp.]
MLASHKRSWSSFILLIAYGLYSEVIRENTYLSKIVELHENQQAVGTDLYDIIRHLMYLATILLFLSMPFVLDSFTHF